MPSNNIYSSTKVLPYVYRCTNKITGEFYIGYRTANKVPSSVDLPKYKTSSKVVNPNFHEYDWVIIAEFFDSISAYDFEQVLIFENLGNPLLLNKWCYHGKMRFINSFAGKSHSNSTKLKISNTLNGHFVSAETKKRQSEAWKSRQPMSNETKYKIGSSLKGKKVENSTKLKISNTLKGHFVSAETKKRQSEAGKNREKSICPHCHKLVDICNLKRWHLDNCKFKPSQNI